MVASEVALHVFSGAVPSPHLDLLVSNLHFRVPRRIKAIYAKKQFSHSLTGLSHNRMRIYGMPSASVDPSLQCHCQKAEGVAGLSSDDGNGAWFKDPATTANQILSSTNGQKLLGVEELQQVNNGKAHVGDSDMSASDVAAGHAAHKKKGSSVEDEAWRLLQDSVVYYCGSPVGTIAANDPSDSSVLNYDQVFIRDFIPSGIAFLLKGEYDIVRNFILYTLQLQSWEKTMDCHSPGQGLMPASFKVRTVPLDGDESATEEVLDPDFGEVAIGRVAPVDSDGSCMIDRHMGIHGHPLEIQALFYSALLCAREMLAPEDGSADLIRALNNRLIALSFHIREYYWVDMKKLNEIYRYKTEEYSYEADLPRSGFSMASRVDA